MSVFRNALLHPGAVRPGADAEAMLPGEPVARLAQVLDRGQVKTDRGSDFIFLARELRKSPAAITSEAMALWSLLQLDAIGRFEARRVRIRFADET